MRVLINRDSAGSRSLLLPVEVASIRIPYGPHIRGLEFVCLLFFEGAGPGR
jgi:hypothetical protein